MTASDSTEMSMKSDLGWLEEPKPPLVQVCPRCRKVTGHLLPGRDNEEEPPAAHYACSSCLSIWKLSDTGIVMLGGVVTINSRHANRSKSK